MAILDAARQAAVRVTKYKGRSLNEQNTKATLIEPVLRALGWDLEDLEVVQREHKARPRANPVDYALLRGREPVLFVEAKALGQDLGDEMWASQVLGLRDCRRRTLSAADGEGGDVHGEGSTEANARTPAARCAGTARRTPTSLAA